MKTSNNSSFAVDSIVIGDKQSLSMFWDLHVNVGTML